MNQEQPTTQQREIEVEFSQVVESAALQAAPLFRLFGWQWAGVEGSIKVSNIEHDLNRKIKDLSEADGPMGITSGRLMVRKEKSENGGYDYNISLELGGIFDVPESYEHHQALGDL